MSVDLILRQIDENGDIAQIRCAILDLIAQELQALKGSFGYWEKACLANAIAALAWNIYSRHQPTTVWLRLCLVNVEKARVPAEERDEHYTLRDKQLEALTFQQLAEDIESLRKIGC